MNEHPNPNKTFENVIKNSELPSLAKDYTELAIDGIIDDGVLKDFPLVASVIGVMKFSNSISKHIAAKKLYKFLFELHSIPLEKRVKKIEEINSSKKYQSSVGEMIFELLEKVESDNKPEIVGKLFKAVIDEKIEFQTYLRLVYIVKSMFYYDLLWIKENSNGLKVKNRNYNNAIAMSGLVQDDWGNNYEKVKEMYVGKAVPMHAKSLTYLGDMLINIGMK